MGEQLTYDVADIKVKETERVDLFYFGKESFDTVLNSKTLTENKINLFAQMARFNTLYMITRAGSGHLGSSFSSIDIISLLYLNTMTKKDKFFSSKGHDSPGLYSIQAALGIIEFEQIHLLRKLGGLPGHPTYSTPGSHTNTGSLGMGISKAKGFLKSAEILKIDSGNVFVMLGDGELQEGQIWESLIKVNLKNKSKLTIIIDHNKIQSDTYVENVADLGDLKLKFESFGCWVEECNGHDFGQIKDFLNKKNDKVKVLIANTIKGKGVSFMEHTYMSDDEEYYKFHSGAPTSNNYKKAASELMDSIKNLTNKYDIDLPEPQKYIIYKNKSDSKNEKMIDGYSKIVLKKAISQKKIIALDADLVLDTGLIPFKNKFPDRYIQCGISEQDMVSQAGTMASSGLIPIVHSFSCFLTSRPSEQIYNNCLQNSKVIYVGSLAGLYPSGPGSSHQSVRDITAMAGMGLDIIEPISITQLDSLFNLAVNKSINSSYFRLTSIPYKKITLNDDDYNLKGRGSVLIDGSKILIVSAGPIMTNNAIKVSNRIKKINGLDVKLITTPWLNNFDPDWFSNNIKGCNHIIILENHYVEYGFGSYLSSQLVLKNVAEGCKIKVIGLTSKPQCGMIDEVAKFHSLDSDSIYHSITSFIKK